MRSLSLLKSQKQGRPFYVHDVSRFVTHIYPDGRVYLDSFFLGFGVTFVHHRASQRLGLLTLKARHPSQALIARSNERFAGFLVRFRRE